LHIGQERFATLAGFELLDIVGAKAMQKGRPVLSGQLNLRAMVTNADAYGRS
jgi:hypothetical protein